MKSLRDASIRVILENQSPSGAYVASPAFRVYDYSWFRDGAFIADAMLDAGETHSAQIFHDWVARIIISRKSKILSLIEKHEEGIEISHDEHLHCRYTTDGLEASDSWTNFQLDGFGTWLWALDRFDKAGNKLNPQHLQAAELLIDYLSTFWKIPSFDWWEESFGYLHISTLGAISKGLELSSHWSSISHQRSSTAKEVSLQIDDLIAKNGFHGSRLTKWIDGDGLDGSLAALVSPLEYIKADTPLARNTLEAIEKELGLLGTFRHADDEYFGGGKWIILSVFLALGFIELGETGKAQDVLEWVTTTADQDQNLPEQVSTELLHPEMKQEWVDRWGIPAQPLLWSHAMYLKLYEKLAEN